LTEAAVRAVMEAALAARGMSWAYPSIVTTHGEVLHNERHDNVLAEGDLLLADVGAETAAGWAGDVTRTWPVSGTYSTPQRELYQVVLSAQRQAIAAVSPGARYRNIHVLACQALASGPRRSRRAARQPHRARRRRRARAALPARRRTPHRARRA
jgi:Xaa-Pro aminopeptidase